MEDGIQIETELEELLSETELTTVEWWERNRRTYNIVMLLAGALGFIGGLANGRVSIIAITLAYAIFMNICYTLGIILELILSFYINNGRRMPALATFIFIAGTFVSVLLTFFGGLLFLE